jgi:hypothetical protein
LDASEVRLDVTKMSRKIVVDASVARAAGTRENPSSIACRLFLEGMRRVGQREWIKHRSNFSALWLGSMQRHRRVVWVNPDSLKEAEFMVIVESASPLSISQVEAIKKDKLLVLAAYEVDRTIASCDDKMRKLLCVLAKESDPIGSLVWVNPVNPLEGVQAWLEAGARSVDERKLKNFKI